jgi:2,4-dienoyl-CoA reductase-like NADH-dependent reductase (Old Yellow Enzyme family)
MTSHLFSPLTLRGLTLRNRLIVSPMLMSSANDGSASDWHVLHTGSLSQSSAGLVFLEATSVSPEGRITPRCLGLWSDENESALERVLKAVRPYATSPIGIQLAHAGRKASSDISWKGGKLLALDNGGWTAIGPSALPQHAGERLPAVMSAADIDRVVDDFSAATQRAARLGFDAIELHAAHGYLLHEFLSPVSNRRTDEYGGSLKNRMRLLLRVFDAMRASYPSDRPLGVRISVSDWLEHTDTPSWTTADSVVLARELKARGCDWIDASSGGVSPEQQIAIGPGYQLPFAEAVRKQAGIATVGVGLITTPHQAEQAIAGGQADLVAIARAWLWNPRWVWHAAAELGAQVMPPMQYNRAPPSGYAHVFPAVSRGFR